MARMWLFVRTAPGVLLEMSIHSVLSIRTSLRPLLWSILLGFSLPWPLQASQSFQPVSPEELKMTGEPKAPGAQAIILYRQVDRDDNSRTSHEDNYFRIKILTEEGRKHADIEIPFARGQNDVVNIHARTIRPDGSIRPFDGQVFEKMIERERGRKYLAKTFTLPDVQVGSILEYYFTYDLHERSLFDSHWILNQDLFIKTVRFSLKPFDPTFENPFRIRWSGKLPPAMTSPKKAQTTSFAWKLMTFPLSRAKITCPRKTS